MKSKILIAIPLLFASTNLAYLAINQFFIDIHYENILLIINSVFMIILLIIYYKQSKKDPLVLYESDDYSAINIPTDSFQINTQILINHFPNFLCIKDKNGRWLGASDIYLKLFNLQDVDYIGKTDAELFHYSNSNVDILKVSFIQDKSAWHIKEPVKETRTVILDRQRKTLEITRIPIFDKYGNELKLIVTGYFVNEDDKKKTQLELLPKVFEICHLSFIFLDKNFHITEVNTAFSLLAGYSTNELIGKPLSFIIKGKLTHLQTDFFTNNPRRLWSGELICLPKSGRDFPVKLEISSITKEDNNIVYFGSLQDITNQKQAEKRIMRLSYYDELTGLINRSMFYDRLRKFIASAKIGNIHGTVFVIDLDRFKIINESLGHDAGNELLKVIAQRLQELIGANDIAARLSGDEFAMLMLSDQTYEQTVYAASIVAGKISQKLSEVISVNNHDAFIGSSIGISIYPEDCRTTEIMLKAEMLLKNADIARNNAKSQGKNGYQFYNKDFSTVSQDKLLMELNLRKAIEKNELKLHYQPQYEANSKKLCGAEVLIRWNRNNEKMVPPDQFITLAEDTGLIIEIGYWILRTACQQLKIWINAGYPLEQVSVNVSAQQFNDTNFINLVKKALNESGLAAKHLELEITESMLIGDARFIDLQLQQLKRMGIKLALDDFGTGYSSLAYLKNFPIDVLKMDQSFVKGMTLDSKNAKIACAIIEIGHSLGQKVIAEGVETKEQFDFLRKHGCDIIQGYYFSKPLPAEEMTNFLKNDFDKFLIPVKKNPFE
jgi:diguanylate cyclase (GGDEF)-like protein/PAS domain S-box-containing protein